MPKSYLQVRPQADEIGKNVSESSDAPLGETVVHPQHPEVRVLEWDRLCLPEPGLSEPWRQLGGPFRLLLHRGCPRIGRQEVDDRDGVDYLRRQNNNGQRSSEAESSKRQLELWQIQRAEIRSLLIVLMLFRKVSVKSVLNLLIRF